jgi:hypothetical protein
MTITHLVLVSESKMHLGAEDGRGVLLQGGAPTHTDFLMDFKLSELIHSVFQKKKVYRGRGRSSSTLR